MQSIVDTMPKSSDEDILISGRHSFLMPNSVSIYYDHFKVLISISIVRLALLESVRMTFPAVSF